MINHSCIRCRTKKLKCDGGSPCGNCDKKGKQEECLHVKRKARPRKSRNVVSFSSTSSSFTDSPQSPQTPKSGLPLLPTAPLKPNNNTINKNNNNSNNNSSSTSPQNTLLGLAREALGDEIVCTDLIKYVFYWRVQSLSYASIDVELAINQITAIFHNDDDSASSLEPDEIVLCMMIIALSLQYLPKKDIPLNLLARLKAIDTSLGPRLRQDLLWQLSLNFIRHQMNQRNHTFTHIQTLILVLLYDQTGEALRDQINDHAVRTCQHLGLHRIDKDDGSRLNEFKVRAWWFFVARSWFASLSNSLYTIHPHQFSTRLPVERIDIDLFPSQRNVINNKPASSSSSSSSSTRYLVSSFGLSLITLADLIRRLIDYRVSGKQDFRQVVQEEFEQYTEQLPEEFSFANTKIASEAADSNLEKIILAFYKKQRVERWLLHQQIFHAFLELHHFDPTEPIPLASIALANHTIDIQGIVSNGCYVLDSLRLNVTNITKAASVLVFDLLQQQTKSSIARSITLGKIKQALRKCEEITPTRPQDFKSIREMLDLEEKMWKQSKQQQLIGSSPSSKKLPFSFHPVVQQKVEMLDDMIPPPLDPTEVDWSSFLPSDAGIYPVFLADNNENEWQNLYQTFLDTTSNVKL